MNTPKPAVSVIMSVYNTEEAWLRESIQSILDQSFRNFEFIIVLDSPTDGSEGIVREYAETDERIVVLKNQENIGLTKSLNKAIQAAAGRYIARMDADDISVSTRFEKQVAYLDSHENVAVVGSRCFLSVTRRPILNNWTEDQQALAVRMMFANAGLPHPTAMIRRSTLDQHSIRYTESIRKSQDYKLWVDLLPYGDIMVLPDVLLVYREHEGQITADTGALNEYAHQIALMQAERLLGELSETEKQLHVTVMKTELPASAAALDRYFRRIAAANREKGIYRQDTLLRELDFLWCRKAVRRMKVEHKADMLLRARTLKMFEPALMRYIRKNKESTKAYVSAVREFEAAQKNSTLASLHSAAGADT